MKKKFKINNFDCANCASKMEEEINKVDGVIQASISFVMQKLTIEADDNKFDEIMQKANEICKKIEPDCSIQL